jgi:DNA-binding MarR family transcriptional regulator
LTASPDWIDMAVMSSPRNRPRRPIDQLEAGRAFFAGLDLDVGHFAAMWHSLKVGQLLESDLNRISATHGVSLADFHLLGALMIDAPAPLRATDLALALTVSNAVLTGRITSLERKGLVTRTPSATDRRAIMVHLTDAGADKVKAVGAALEQEGRFIRHYHRLPMEDQQALARIMGDLHTLLDRDFLPVARSKP